MVSPYNLYSIQPSWFLIALLLFIVWELVWKGLGLWHAARHKQTGWFIAILVINLLGLLPIIYLLWFKPQRVHAEELVEEEKSAARQERRQKRTKGRKRGK